MDKEKIDYFLEMKEITKDKVEINENQLMHIKKVLKDRNYFDFILYIGNGGLFFKQSLQLYAFAYPENFISIGFVNQVLNNVYGSLFQNHLAFGQDIFGNQFAFDLSNQKIISFDCESGDKKILANNFNDWLEVLIKDLDYLTGMSYAVEWSKENILQANQRLVPKKPFVIGGEYSVENFYALDFPKYLSYNSEIAKQIFNLKDGENVQIIFKNMQDEL